MNAEILEKLPKTAKEALKQWDAGKIMWSVEMGGLGPSYEQSIQFTAFELIRRLRNVKDITPEILNRETMEIEKEFHIGHSGASAGAATHIASMFLKNGYREALKRAPLDRLIQVEKAMSKWLKEGKDGISKHEL